MNQHFEFDIFNGLENPLNCGIKTRKIYFWYY